MCRGARCQAFPQCAAAGDILEQAVFLSVRLQDEAAFERNYLQLKTYYTDTKCAPRGILRCQPLSMHAPEGNGPAPKTRTPRAMHHAGL